MKIRIKSVDDSDEAVGLKVGDILPAEVGTLVEVVPPKIGYKYYLMVNQVEVIPDEN